MPYKYIYIVMPLKGNVRLLTSLSRLQAILVDACGPGAAGGNDVHMDPTDGHVVGGRYCHIC